MNQISIFKQWLLHWMRKHWVISTLLLLCALWNGFWWAVFTPIRNPWPQEAFTIRGRFPFDKGYELMFYQNVYGMADWHKRLCGGGIFYLLGYQTSKATCSGGGISTKPRQIDGQHYEVTLYRDAYFAGFQNWTSNTFHTQYKVGVDYNTIRGFTSYGAPENSACDDSEEFLRKYSGKLFCTKQTTHKDYKQLVIREGQPAGPNERIQNFWLESELDQMLRQQK
jgi:hypothetical protein